MFKSNYNNAIKNFWFFKNIQPGYSKNILANLMLRKAMSNDTKIYHNEFIIKKKKKFINLQTWLNSALSLKLLLKNLFTINFFNSKIESSANFIKIWLQILFLFITIFIINIIFWTYQLKYQLFIDFDKNFYSIYLTNVDLNKILLTVMNVDNLIDTNINQKIYVINPFSLYWIIDKNSVSTTEVLVNSLWNNYFYNNEWSYWLETFKNNALNYIIFNLIYLFILVWLLVFFLLRHIFYSILHVTKDYLRDFNFKIYIIIFFSIIIFSYLILFIVLHKLNINPTEFYYDITNYIISNINLFFIILIIIFMTQFIVSKWLWNDYKFLFGFKNFILYLFIGLIWWNILTYFNILPPINYIFANNLLINNFGINFENNLLNIFHKLFFKGDSYIFTLNNCDSKVNTNVKLFFNIKKIDISTSLNEFSIINWIKSINSYLLVDYIWNDTTNSINISNNNNNNFLEYYNFILNLDTYKNYNINSNLVININDKYIEKHILTLFYKDYMSYCSFERKLIEKYDLNFTTFIFYNNWLALIKILILIKASFIYLFISGFWFLYTSFNFLINYIYYNLLIQCFFLLKSSYLILISLISKSIKFGNFFFNNYYSNYFIIILLLLVRYMNQLKKIFK